MSDAEKLVEAGLKYPADPLILRPRVGGDLLRASNRPAGSFCWPRNFILRITLISVILTTIAGCILIIFALRHSNAWPWYRQHYRGGATGFCRALTSYPGFEVEERYVYEPSAVTITHGPVAGFPSASIFHLLNDFMTVIRTNGTCYAYPLNREVVEAIPVDDGVVERMKETTDMKFKSPFGLRVFMMRPGLGSSVRITHPAAAANCSDVPIISLVEMLLSEASMQLDPGAEAVSLPVECPKECPRDVSRDGVGLPRQVCRCPPKADPPTDLLKGNRAAPLSLDDEGRAGANDANVVRLPDDDDNDDDIDDSFDLVDSSLDDSNAWLPEDDGELLRSRRAATDLHNLEPPIKIPSGCRVHDKVLGGAMPNEPTHTLPIMTIVKC
ncbi:unnamed protein product [Mesocestoides corti]|uniref:Integral membrane protein 2 n=1 Tax=Mesocestoides corti TaxID=53468 RepID=A0A0R3U514_MESCO|nr:unnamed protein product [Mesocestoides corti]